MEPLSIFGLAVNIVQLVDFSTRLLREAHEIYQSGTGNKAEHVELDQVSANLSSMCDALPSTADTTPEHQGHQLHDKDTIEIARAARRVAQDLVAVIRKLGAEGASKKKWKSFRQALATLWSKDEIESLKRRLGELRGQLHIQLTTRMLKEQNQHSTQLAALRKACEQTNARRLDAIDDLVKQVARLREMGLSPNSLRHIDSVVARSTKLTDHIDRETRILEDLRFDVMFDRYHSITEAHEQTFQWIFKTQSLAMSDPRSRIAFVDWLLNGDDIFWVSGKPGSGKSTLMRYLTSCSTTHEHLRAWAGDNRLVTPSFYFWMAGTELQRTQIGLLRQLLFEILRQFPDLISRLCTSRWAMHYPAPNEWTIYELRNAFDKLEGVMDNTKICFFIDGLDEYDGDHLELIKILQKLSAVPNIKLCVSSRRWVCFEDAFGTSTRRKLYLEDLTQDDIMRFATDKLQESPQDLCPRLENQECQDVVAEITRRAQGVFLWVSLVIRSLKEGLMNGDSVSLLWKRLREIPTDLEKFFEKIIKSVDSVYLDQMAVTFSIALATPDPISLVTYLLMDEDRHLNERDATQTSCLNVEVFGLEKTMSRRLYGRYKGLLEATGRPGTQRVDFLHRTVRDYMLTKNGHAIFEVRNVSPYTTACRAFVSYLTIFGSEGFYRVDNQKFFMIFARKAEESGELFDRRLFDEMVQASTASFGSNILFIKEAVRYGATLALEQILKRDPSLCKKSAELILTEAPFELDGRAQSLFGQKVRMETMAWMFRNASWFLASMPKSKVLISFLISTELRGLVPISRTLKYGYFRSIKISDDLDLWRGCLQALCHHGVNINGAFEDTNIQVGLPWIGPSNENISEIVTIATLPLDFMNKIPELLKNSQQIRDALHTHLDRLLNAYSCLMEFDLDPNRLRGNMSIWEIWLFTICDWQTNHGLLEEICAKAIRIFLAHGADPHATVLIVSDRISENHPSVVYIIENLFGQDNRYELRREWETAVHRWQDSRSAQLHPNRTLVQSTHFRYNSRHAGWY